MSCDLQVPVSVLAVSPGFAIKHLAPSGWRPIMKTLWCFRRATPSFDRWWLGDTRKSDCSFAGVAPTTTFGLLVRMLYHWATGHLWEARPFNGLNVAYLFKLVSILNIIFSCLDLVLSISVLGKSELADEVLQLNHETVHHLRGKKKRVDEMCASTLEGNNECAVIEHSRSSHCTQLRSANKRLLGCIKG